MVEEWVECEMIWLGSGERCIVSAPHRAPHRETSPESWEIFPESWETSPETAEAQPRQWKHNRDSWETSPESWETSPESWETSPEEDKDETRWDVRVKYLHGYAQEHTSKLYLLVTLTRGLPPF